MDGFASDAKENEVTRYEHVKISPADGRDFTVSKVVEWVMQRGGFIPSTPSYAIVEEELNVPFRTLASDGGN